MQRRKNILFIIIYIYEIRNYVTKVLFTFRENYVIIRCNMLSLYSL